MTNNNSWKGPLNNKLDVLCRWLCVCVTPPWRVTLFSECNTHLDNYKLPNVTYINITVLYVRRILHLSVLLAAIFCLNLLPMHCLAHIITTYSVKHTLKASTWLEYRFIFSSPAKWFIVVTEKLNPFKSGLIPFYFLSFYRFLNTLSQVFWMSYIFLPSCLSYFVGYVSSSILYTLLTVWAVDFSDLTAKFFLFVSWHFFAEAEHKYCVIHGSK
jgi:hypothetical protein